MEKQETNHDKCVSIASKFTIDQFHNIRFEMSTNNNSIGLDLVDWPVFPCRSDPAKSTRFNFPTLIFSSLDASSGSLISIRIANIECDLEMYQVWYVTPDRLIQEVPRRSTQIGTVQYFLKQLHILWILEQFHIFFGQYPRRLTQLRKCGRVPENVERF